MKIKTSEKSVLVEKNEVICLNKEQISNLAKVTDSKRRKDIV